MNDAQLTALRSRMMRADAYGYAVAKAGLYMEELAAMGGDVDPPMGAAKGSAAHLLAMCDACLAGGGKKRAKPKPAPAPKTVPSPAPADDDEGYEDWSKEDLYAEAQERGIDGRSKMDKADLVEALYGYDEEHDGE